MFESSSASRSSFRIGRRAILAGLILFAAARPVAMGGPIAERFGRWSYQRQAKASMLKAYAAQNPGQVPARSSMLSTWKQRLTGSPSPASKTFPKRSTSMDFDAGSFHR